MMMGAVLNLYAEYKRQRRYTPVQQAVDNTKVHLQNTQIGSMDANVYEHKNSITEHHSTSLLTSNQTVFSFTHCQQNLQKHSISDK